MQVLEETCEDCGSQNVTVEYKEVSNFYKVIRILWYSSRTLLTLMLYFSLQLLSYALGDPL